MAYHPWILPPIINKRRRVARGAIAPKPLNHPSLPNRKAGGRKGGREGGHSCGLSSPHSGPLLRPALPPFRFLVLLLLLGESGVFVGNASVHDGLHAVAAVLREGREGGREGGRKW